MTTDYSGNSNKAKEMAAKAETPKVVAPIEGIVVVGEKKIGIVKRFKQIFFAGDAKTTASNVATELVFPAIKAMMADAGKGAIERMIYGENARFQRRSPSPLLDNYRPQVNYSTTSRRLDSRPGMLPDQAPRPSTSHQSTEIILGSREMAELVRERLMDVISEYEIASVADFYDILGQPQSVVDNRYGWTDLSSARVTPVRDGYLLELPNPTPIPN